MSPPAPRQASRGAPSRNAQHRNALALLLQAARLPARSAAPLKAQALTAPKRSAAARLGAAVGAAPKRNELSRPGAAAQSAPMRKRLVRRQLLSGEALG